MRLAAVALLLAACGSGPTTPAGGDDDMTPDAPGSDPGPDTRLEPLAVGRTWTYAIDSTYASCPGGTHDQAVTATETVDGHDAFAIMSFCGLVGHERLDGDIVEDYYDWGPIGWTRMLDGPVADGHTWTTTNGSATFGMMLSRETVAGRGECWRVTQQVSYTSYWIYCRGVGLVESEMIDLAGGTIHATLQSTSF
jgi:hypothetical protein